MKRDKLRRTGNALLANEIGYEAGNDDLYETELERASADVYEQRRKIWLRMNKGDWWIAVAIYLAFASMAFVVF